MADVTNIYLVTAGEYSSYTVIAAFSDEGLAYQYAAHAEGIDGYSTAEVETYELRGTLPPLLEVLSLSAEMLADGHVYNPEEKIEKEWADQSEARPVRTWVVPHTYLDPHHISIRVWGTDHARVRKVMTEVLARCKAEAFLMLQDGETVAATREFIKSFEADG